MKKINANGFALTEVLVVLVVLIIVIGVGVLVFSRINAANGSTVERANDTEISESLKKTKQALSEFVTTNKTIPTTVDELSGVSYGRIDNQQAELCATFLTTQLGASVTPSFWDKLTGKASIVESTHEVYRDNVDFSRHAKGRNCYRINYAPINEAYDKKYEAQKKTHKVCDSYRQYHSKFTGQTIKGFFIGGSFTANPGAGGDRLVLAQDADAYDAACKKIPVSELKVGDKAELFVEDGPVNGSERTYFVKAIKKEF
jgi:type II secretory pathway pseudopilin PulG